MDELLMFLNSIYPLSNELKKHLEKILKPRELGEGELLLKAGHYCENVYFVNQGLLRSYYHDKRDNEKNIWFMKEGDVVYAVRSFLDQIPSKEFIQALEDTTVYYISHRELEQIYDEYMIFNIHGRKLTQEYYKRSVEREDIMRMPEAIERYQYLLEHFPELVNRVPDKHLATFLRMTPVTLSRMRNNRMKKVPSNKI